MSVQQQYDLAIKEYKDLEILVSKKIAGTVENNKCPDELLKHQLSILKIYINILKERLNYE